LLSHLKTRFAILLNRFLRRNGLSLRDQCAKVIMHMCTLQLERGETRDIAPTTGATGPMTLAGGAITTITYRVFDRSADKVDPEIKKEPWRAFGEVILRITVERDPEFEVKIDGKEVEPTAVHKSPGLLLIQHLSQYFPLLPKAFAGTAYIPFSPPGGAA
jgi:hypothetical protein